MALHALKDKTDFSLVLQKGRRLETGLFRFYFRPNGLGYQRFAFLVSRAVDKRAVVRNSLRRRAKEWVRKNKVGSDRDLDVIISLKPQTKPRPQKEFYEELAKALAKII